METPRNMPDQILIEELELSAHLGVPAAERAHPQRLTISVTLELHTAEDAPPDFADDLTRTVDYAVVALALQAEARRHPRQLLETLATDLATLLLRDFPRLSAVELTVRKYILPDAHSVAYRLRRTQKPSHEALT